MQGLLTLDFSIGRFARTDVRIDITLIIFGLMVVFAPGQSFLLKLALFILLFFTIFLHEMGHVIATRRTGGTSDTIVLWPLGGMALGSASDRPLHHFLVAGAGPLVTLVIICFSWVYLTFLSPSTLLFECLNYVFRTNTYLLLFNLLPAYPLDGGQMLQAGLWAKFGYTQGTRITCYVSIVIAVLVAIFAIAANQWLLLTLAIIIGFEARRTLLQNPALF